ATIQLNDPVTYPSASNDRVQRIDTLKVPVATTSILIQGGRTNPSAIAKGRVAEVQLASDLLTNPTKVTKVVFSNLNFTTQVQNLSRILPINMQTLQLDNTLLTAFPPGLSRFTKLKLLYRRDINRLTQLLCYAAVEI
uniref:Uncharacterized protein n=1 Tax=Globisporangium ultimum (strain ATCC 200006 / CBS 805.95 / DAOM BR144) TaxID=431595 RepID=K3X7K0_GLOUD